MNCFVFSFVILLLSAPPLALAKYHKLAMQWGISFCNNHISCTKTPVQEFTIHGLWNFYDNHSIQIDCGGNHILTWGLAKAVGGLERDWPNLKGNDFEFWENEWKKHGTCSHLEPIPYFLKAVDKRGDFDIMKAFRKSGIFPGSTLTTAYDITKSFQDGYKHIPEVECNFDYLNNVQLFEIRICFTHENWELKNCTVTGSVSCFSMQNKIRFPDLNSYNSYLRNKKNWRAEL